MILDEKLFEDLDEISDKGPETGESTGIADLIISNIKDEWETNAKYNYTIATVQSLDIPEELKNSIVDIIQDINKEELNHVGMLQKALALLAPNTEAIENGQEEAQEHIENAEKKDLQENFNPVMLKSAGLVRDPSNDFSDDGNRFRAYLYKGILPVTYLRDGDDIYFSISFHHIDDINYDDYKKFSTYPKANKYNGIKEDEIDISELTKLLDDAYNDVIEFRKNVKPADRDKAKEYYNNYAEYYEDLVREAKELIANNIEKLYEKDKRIVSEIFDYAKTLKKRAENFEKLDVDSMSESVLRSVSSDEAFEKQKKEIEERKNFYLEQIKDLLL